MNINLNEKGFRKYKSRIKEKQCKLQWEDYEVKKENIKLDLVIEEFNNMPDGEYKRKVQLLFGRLKKFAKKDFIQDIDEESYLYKGTSIPEVTHILTRLNAGKNQVWSKDIDDEGNRFCYNIVEKDFYGMITKKVVVLQISGHSDKLQLKDVITESKTFSDERLAEREQWIQEHSKMSKTSQKLLMPLHLRYPDIQPFDESFKQALEKAEQQRLKTVRQEPIPEPEPLTIKLLYENDIKGTLFERRHDKPWKVITK